MHECIVRIVRRRMISAEGTCRAGNKCMPVEVPSSAVYSLRRPSSPVPEPTWYTSAPPLPQPFVADFHLYKTIGPLHVCLFLVSVFLNTALHNLPTHPLLSPPSFSRRSPLYPLVRAPFSKTTLSKMSTTTSDVAVAPKLEKKPVKFSNLLLGAGLNMFEVTTLGQVNGFPWTLPSVVLFLNTRNAPLYHNKQIAHPP